MNYTTNYMVHANSTSKLTKVWAFHKSQKNFDKLPLMTQLKISKENKSWLNYFKCSFALGLINEADYKKARHYIVYKGMQKRNINWKDILNES